MSDDEQPKQVSAWEARGKLYSTLEEAQRTVDEAFIITVLEDETLLDRDAAEDLIFNDLPRLMREAKFKKFAEAFERYVGTLGKKP